MIPLFSFSPTHFRKLKKKKSMFKSIKKETITEQYNTDPKKDRRLRVSDLPATESKKRINVDEHPKKEVFRKGLVFFNLALLAVAE